MLWRPDTTSDETCLWTRSGLGARGHAWFVSLQPAGTEVTYETSAGSVTAYADGLIAGHAVTGESGVRVTVAPGFGGRGIEERLVAEATRIGAAPVREAG